MEETRETIVAGLARNMDDSRGRKEQLDHPKVHEVARHFIDHPPRLAADRSELRQVLLRGLIQRARGEIDGALRIACRRVKSIWPGKRQLVDPCQFPASKDLWVAGQDLFDQAGAGSRHPYHKNRNARAIRRARKPFHPRRAEHFANSASQFAVFFQSEGMRPGHVRFRVKPERLRKSPERIAQFSQGKKRCLALFRRQLLFLDQPL